MAARRRTRQEAEATADTKAPRKKARRRASAAARRAATGPAQAFRAKVRMYRHGLGDCFLVTLPRANGAATQRDFFILIDCGVILGTPDAPSKMTAVVEDIVATTGGTVDLLLATHEHWDHLSGFVQAEASFAKLSVGEVWLPWTEDPSDTLAQTLRGEREAALTALRLSANRMRLSGDDQGADEVGSLLEFFGAGAGSSTKEALEKVRKLAGEPTYCRPDMAPRAPSDLDGVRLYVLGPPRDEKLIRKIHPSTKNPETYGLALDVLLDQIGPDLDDAADRPFSTLFAIPTIVAKEIDFFKACHWEGEQWRRIDTAGFDAAAELALQLDSRTNNTSLVLAIELADKDVVLFVADAQVGNWQSWQSLSWPGDDAPVTGPDLLRRTILYKVGHHGSHNATLRQHGLEMMERLGAAMVPVDHAMAVKKRWHKIPLPELVDALMQKTGGQVFRSDQPAPAAGRYPCVAKDLFFELVL